MATHHAAPGGIVDLTTWANDLPEEKTKAIVKTNNIELARLVLPAGKEIPKHKISGPIVVHCIKGKIEFTAMDATKELKSGQLLHLMPNEPHSIMATKDSVILLVIVFK